VVIVNGYDFKEMWSVKGLVTAGLPAVLTHGVLASLKVFNVLHGELRVLLYVLGIVAPFERPPLFSFHQ
jgi:hypothetical protein